MSKSVDVEVRDYYMEEMPVPGNFDSLEEFIRSVSYPSLEDMPKEERRAQRISFIMGMLPRGVNMTREQVEKFIDNQNG